MRHHDRWVAGMLLLLFGIAIAVFLSQQRIDALGEELAAQEEYSEQLLREYGDLVDVNTQMRERISELGINLSMARSEAAVCRETLGPRNFTARSQRVSIDDIRISEDTATINIQDLYAGIIAPSSSMAPYITESNIVLETAPTSAAQVLPGDIIVYERGDSRIIHRVVRIGWDAQGWFAITRGDNNPVEDPEKVRFPEVRGILVAVIY